MPHVVAAEPRQEGGFLDRTVTLARGVDDEGPGLGLQAAPGEAVVGGPLAGAQQGRHGGGGGGVLDHAAPGVGEAHQLPHPIDDHFFQFRQRGARLPRQAQDAQAGAEVVAQNTGKGGVGRKVSEEAGVLPVREARQEDLFQVAKHRREAFGAIGGEAGNRALTSPGAVRAITGNPARRAR